MTFKKNTLIHYHSLSGMSYVMIRNIHGRNSKNSKRNEMKGNTVTKIIKKQFDFLILFQECS